MKVFKSGPSKICGTQPLKNLKWYDLSKQIIPFQIFKSLASKTFTWSILEYLDPSINSAVFSIWNSLRVLQKARVKIMARAIYTYLFFFAFIYILFCWKIKSDNDRW